MAALGALLGIGPRESCTRAGDRPIGSTSNKRALYPTDGNNASAVQVNLRSRWPKVPGKNPAPSSAISNATNRIWRTDTRLTW